MIGWLSFTSSKARMKLTQQKGEGRMTLKIKMWAEVHAALAPDEEAPHMPSKIERKKVEAEKLEEVGRLPESSPTKQLAQMAVETGPSIPGGEELARRKL